MEANMTAALGVDSQAMQKMIGRVMSEAIRSLPRPKVPRWMEAIVDFIKFHPWLSLLIFICVILVISAIIREVICSYFKTNDILIRLKRIEEKLK